MPKSPLSLSPPPHNPILHRIPIWALDLRGSDLAKCDSKQLQGWVYAGEIGPCKASDLWLTITAEAATGYPVFQLNFGTEFIIIYQTCKNSHAWKCWRSLLYFCVNKFSFLIKWWISNIKTYTIFPWVPSRLFFFIMKISNLWVKQGLW